MGADPRALLDPLERFGIKLGLESIGRVLGELGDPHLRAGQVLVAGTNGKGSTAATLASILSAAGSSTGLYTSPHLERVEERLRIDGRAIDSEALYRLLSLVIETAKTRTGHPPTYFEALTAAAFLWFAQRNVAAEVLEVGLGGRLDATNCADPELSVITSIGWDHTEELGSTLGAIAAEKAGIFRPGRPAVAWDGPAEVRTALERSAAEVGADLEWGGSTVRLQIDTSSWDGWRGTIETPGRSYRVTSSLAGPHQATNVALAVRSAERLYEARGVEVEVDAVEAGVSSVRWSGRLESVPLPDGRRLVLDAAHNAAGAESLGDFLGREGEPFALLFGALRDKDAAAMLEALRGARSVIAVAPSSGRARVPEDLAAFADVEIAETPLDGLERLLSRDEPVLVVAGSIYLVGEARGLLRGMLGVPGPA